MRFVRLVLTLALVGSLFLIGGSPLPADAAPTDQSVWGLTTDNRLIRFRSYDPGTITATRTITGLEPGEKVVGIDFRPATGELWAVGSTSRLYTIDPATGAATEEAVLSTPLSGTFFGVDFNPVVDRLRIVSNTDQNLRVVPDTGAVTVDGTLAYAPGKYGGTNPAVKAVAYTNSQCGPADPMRTTALFDIDHNENLLAQQNPPNDGTLTAIGGLGLDTRVRVGFDVSPNNNVGYVSVDPVNPLDDQTSRLATIDLATGDLSLLGRIGPASPTRQVLDLAVPFRATCPVP